MQVAYLSLPEEFVRYVFEERRSLLERMLGGEVSPEEVALGFTRHTPVVVTCGPAGLNASVKGVGLVPREGLVADLARLLCSELEGGVTRGRAIRLLLERVYRREVLDLTKLSSIELAKGHTWANVQRRPEATLLFYTPPSVSYEVRCRVEVHSEGPYWEFVNAVHDLFHGGRPSGRWSERPVYIFRVVEIYDNSPSAMGARIYP